MEVSTSPTSLMSRPETMDIAPGRTVGVPAFHTTASDAQGVVAVRQTVPTTSPCAFTAAAVVLATGPAGSASRVAAPSFQANALVRSANVAVPTTTPSLLTSAAATVIASGTVIGTTW